jgi:hypothetical protein
MKKRIKLNREVIRQLSVAELKPVAAGDSQLETCSHCLGVAGCNTGARCP